MTWANNFLGGPLRRRDLKLRGSFIKSGELIKMPGEKVINRIGNVMNLANNQGNMGSFILTHARVVWHANHNESFNVSIPFTQILSVKIRDSKFGQALVVETSPKAGGYLLGFSTNPPERCDHVCTPAPAWRRSVASVCLSLCSLCPPGWLPCMPSGALTTGEDHTVAAAVQMCAVDLPWCCSGRLGFCSTD